MASLIKNQILKHLSKFAKNLSADQINLSTLKGEGELTNLALNEVVLMDLLELPTWLKLTKAICNKVSIKIQWTKLKSVPLFVLLDEVLVEMETCEKLRQGPPPSLLPSYSSGGKYGFSDQVIDGMTVNINSVEIKFKSSAFHASFQLSRLRLESRNPNWHRTDLRLTRLKDPERGELLIFKELEWQTLRIEAAATDPKSAFTSPLRLITNQARCRITVKKRLADCAIIASRLMLIVDDLLWVLTDTQIQAALHFLSSLSSLRLGAERDKKLKAALKLELMPSPSQLSQQLQPGSGGRSAALRSQNTVAKVFNMYDIVETSIHIYSARIDIHFCDDSKPGEGRSSHPQLSDGAAMQVTLNRLAFDYYPYHLAYGERKHWLRYSEANTSHAAWVEQLMASYRQQLLDLAHGTEASAGATRPHASPRQRSPSHGPSPTSPHSQEDRRRSSGQSKSALVATFLRRLMASCVVLRLDDFTVYQVSTASTRKRVPDKFLSSDKGRLMLPASMPALHIEISDFYFPGDDDFPVPLTHVYAQANPTQLTVDTFTVLWLNAFLLNLQKSQNINGSFTTDVFKPLDIRLEALMPRVVIPATKEFPNQPDRPRSLQVQISRFVATNCRVGENCGLIHLQQCLETFQTGTLFLERGFPSDEGDINPLHEAFYLHSLGEDSWGPSTPCGSIGADHSWGSGATTRSDSRDRAAWGGSSGSLDETGSVLRKDMLWTANKAVWCVQLEPVWIDFCGMESCRNRPSPFIDAVQASFWIVQNIWPLRPATSHSVAPSSPTQGPLSPDDSAPCSPVVIHILAQFKSLVSIQINHFQYLFLLRASEMLTDITEHLVRDSRNIKKIDTAIGDGHVSSSISVAILLPEVDVSLVVPVKTATKSGSDGGVETESLGGDLSSSAATTGAITRAASATFSMRESHSDNQLALRDGASTLVGSGPSEHLLTSSCSDYGFNGSTISMGRTADGGNTSLEPPCPEQQVPFVEPNADHSDSAPVINGAPADAGTKGLVQKMPGFFGGHQNPMSRSMDVFAVPLDKVPDQLGKTLVSGSIAFKKGFSSLKASLDSALLTPKSVTPLTSPNPPTPDLQSLASSDGYGVDDFDTLSLCSDLSDSEQFLLLQSEGTFLDENLLSTGPPDPSTIEVASEVKEDSSSEQSVASSFKRQDLMQVITFRLGIVEVVHQSSDMDLVLKMKADYLHSEELGILTWEEFQAKFSASARAWQEDAIKYTLPACDTRLRFQSGPKVGMVYSEAVERGFIEVRLTDASLSLLMSTVASLADLFEDEIIPVPIPMKVSLKDVKLHLQEDRPSSNITSPGPIPVNVAVTNLLVKRTPDGAFHVLPGGADSDPTICKQPSSMNDIAIQTEFPEDSEYDFSRSSSIDRSESIDGRSVRRGRRPSLDELDEKVYRLQEENERLRLKVIGLEEATQRSTEESSLLRNVQQELAYVNEEKRSLMATLQLLQEELLTSEQKAVSAASKVPNAQMLPTSPR